MIYANFTAYGVYSTDSLYQWDKNRKLIVNGVNISVSPEVHFTNAVLGKAIVKQGSVSSGTISVDIPNSLLQYPFSIRAYIGVYEGATFKTLETVEIPIIKRARPEDYTLDTGDEVYSFRALENQIANLIANANSTEGNSELIDIRTDTDGNVHTTAGKAIRTQFNNLTDKLNRYTRPNNSGIVYTNNNAVNMVNKGALIHGYYVNTDGSLVASTEWNATEYISIQSGKTLYLYRMGITAFYDSNKTFISYVQTVASVIIPQGAAYMRSCVTNNYVAECFISNRENLTYINDDGYILNSKKDFEDGYISFEVKVNQSKADNATSGASEGEENYIDVNCIVRLPRMFYTSHGKPCKLLMMCHGAGRGVTEWKDHTGYNALVEKFLARGYVVFDCNGFGNDELGYSFWGDSRGVSAWRKAYQYIVDNYNVEKTFSIYAFSMGGLTAMNLAFSGFPNIKSIALGSPVLSLEACYNDSGVTNVIKTLYGMNTTYNADLAIGSDPYRHIVEINNTPYIFNTLPPLKIWYGSTETGENLAVEKERAKYFVTAIKNAGGYAEYREVSGGNHSISYGMDEYCNTDYLLFTERFNLHYETLFN